MVGIYGIKNKINNKIYIGKSKNIKNRWSFHKSNLNKNTHPNNYLQSSWNKYKAENFIFFVIEECELDTLSNKENFWCNSIKSYLQNIGYNLTIPTVDKHYNLTEEGRQKIGKTHKGKFVSKETREKMSKVRKGKFLSEETKIKMRQFKRPKWSEDRKKKLSLSRKGVSNIVTKGKIIYNYNILTNEIKKYDKIVNGVIDTKCLATNIVKCYKNKMIAARQYLWAENLKELLQKRQTIPIKVYKKIITRYGQNK